MVSMSRVFYNQEEAGGRRRPKVPELPEVETVVREVRPHLVGCKFTSLHVSRKNLRRPWLPRWKHQLLGQQVQAVDRRGKWILIDLAGPWLVIHLGMTGQLTVTPSQEPRADHTHLVFELDQPGRQLRFRDIRRFGSASLFLTQQDMENFFQESGLGPEPFSLDPDYWRESLARTNRCLKAILLDQRVVAGVGNIYADESLFEARLHPTRPGNTLSNQEASRLRQSIAKVLHRAIDKRGSSIRNYVGGSGLKGEFQNEFRAYGRTGQPCSRCGTPITRMVLAGRSTHFCPQCQQHG
jgi:formamidopyrimidine-DNA glycosylase